MNFEHLFRHTMTETVTIEPASTLNDYGEATYGAAQTFTVWINRNPRHERSASAEVGTQGARALVYLGQRVESSGARTALADLTTPTAEARLTLPDGSQPPIVEVRELRDPGGDKHVVLVL